jgi:hypothetical protein
MKFLNSIAAGLFIASFSILVQAETIEVAAAKKKVIQPGDVLLVTYTLDAKNLGFTCARDLGTPFATNRIVWSNKGFQGRGSLNKAFTADANFRKKHMGSKWVDAKGAIGIENKSATATLSVTCTYLAS